MCVAYIFLFLDSYLATLWESNYLFGFLLVMFTLQSSYFVFVFLSLWCLWWGVWDNCIDSWSLPSLLFSMKYLIIWKEKDERKRKRTKKLMLVYFMKRMTNGRFIITDQSLSLVLLVQWSKNLFINICTLSYHSIILLLLFSLDLQLKTCQSVSLLTCTTPFCRRWRNANKLINKLIIYK